MKKFFLILTFFLFSSTSLFAEYRLEPVNCTIKKKDNCGAYLYNSSTGATYFCDSTKCTEIMPALEEASEEEEDMLDKAWGLESESRLSCQVIVESEELEIELPKYTINMVSEDH